MRLYHILVVLGWLLLPSCKVEQEPFPIFLGEENPFYANYGLVQKPLNFYIPLSPTEKEQYLLIENLHINQIRASFSKRNSELTIGDHLAFGERPIKFRQFILPISPLEGIDTLFLEVDKSMESLSFGLRLFDSVTFIEYQKQDDRLIGFLVGVHTLSILIGLILLPKIVSKKTVFFLLYILLSLFWLLNDAGLFFQYLWPEHPLFHSVSRGLFSTISMGMFAFYVYQNKNERINRMIKKVFVSISIFILFKLFFSFILSLRILPDTIKGYYIFINSIMLLCFFGLLMVLLIKEFLKKDENFFELGAIFIYCFFVFTMALAELGITLIRILPLHQFDSVIFFGFQIFFMTVHIKREETRQKLKALKEFTDFQIFQERHLKKKIIEVEEFERKRIAQNIHDDVGSILAATKYLILSLQKKLSIKDNQNDLIPILNLLDEGVKNQYSIIDDLISKFDKEESLEAAVRKKTEIIFNESGVDCEIRFFLPEHLLSNYQKNQLFRIFTELITNTLKHATATTFVSIQVKDTDPVEISYSDDGKGTESLLTSSKGKGLENIKFRIEQMEGKILELNLKHGFYLLFTIPRQNEKNDLISD